VSGPTLLFYVLTWTAMIALGTGYLASIRTSAHFMAGRYIEGISALFIAIGLRELWLERRLSFRRLTLPVIGLTIFFTLGGIAAAQDSGIVFGPDMLGVYSFFVLFGFSSRGLALASVVALCILGGVALLSGRIRWAGPGALAVLFVSVSLHAYVTNILVLQERHAASSTLAAYLRVPLAGPALVAYDRAYFHPVPFFTYQYLLPRTRFLLFDSSKGEVPPAPVVISGRDWEGMSKLGARFWVAEHQVPTIGADQALWTLPSPLQERLAQQVEYTNTVLGEEQPVWGIRTERGIASHPIWGVWEAGFYQDTFTYPTSPPVWVRREASLVVPKSPYQPIRGLTLNFVGTNPQGTPFQVHVVDRLIFDGMVPFGNWCQTFPLSIPPAQPAVTVVLQQPTAAAEDRLVVRGITLLEQLPVAPAHRFTPDPLPAEGYRSRIENLGGSQPLTLIRGQVGTVRVRVQNTSTVPWPTHCEIGQMPGAVRLGVLWFRQGQARKDPGTAIVEGRANLPLALFPGAELTLTAVLQPITADGKLLPPGDYEVWIGPVQEGVAWFFQKGDGVLRLSVRIVR